VSAVTGKVLSANELSSHNTFESPNVVRTKKFDGVSIKDDIVTVRMPAKSVVALVLY
jgi:alpha-N-arabinofuranosidase